MLFIGCESGLNLRSMKCDSGFVAVEQVAVPGVENSGVDYTVSGQYFGAAFIVSATLILSGLAVRSLLQLIKR